MKSSINLLLVEDCENDALLTELGLARAGFQANIKRVCTELEMTEALEQESWDLILSDYSMPSFNGLQGLSILKQSGRDIPFIILSGTIGEDRAVKAIKAGAKDFVAKGDFERLIPAITRELKEVEERERQRMSEHLVAASEDIFRALLENSLTGIYVIQEYRFVYVNPTLCRILGYSAEELTSGPLLQFVCPEIRDTVEANLKKRLEGTLKSARYELSMIRKNGSIAQIEVHGTRTEYHGSPSIFGILLDVTKRKQAEDHFSRTFHASPHGITLSSAKDGFIIKANEAFLSMTGNAKEDVIGHDLVELGVWANAEEMAGASKSQNRLISLRRKTGELLQVLVSDDKVEVGGETCTLAFFNDITELKKIESQMLRNQRMESIGTLAGGIAHDLNNALAPILMSAQLLRMEAADPKVMRILDVLEGSAKRGAEMVKQVLTFARGIEGKHGIVQLKHLVQDIVTLCKQTFPKSIDVRQKVAGDVWPVKGDSTQLHQVLLNLSVNARDAMPTGGILEISASNVTLDADSSRIHPEATAGAYTELIISDTGSGMPAHIQAKIFDPFFTTKELGKGTGLGLSTVRSIVKNHNGFLILESAENKGTRFKIYLPSLADSQALANGPAPLTLPSGNGECILVVDDEAVIRDIARQMLQTFGYTVLVAANGAEAVALCARNPGKIKVMITDLTMPVMDGAAAIAAVGTIDAEIKVIVASGSVLEGMAKEPREGSVRAVIEKPYTPEKLLTTIHRVLQEKNAVSAT
ncbi:MAG: multi-sensor hybrid histidine kinase [Verrucomicrobiales bacterium]|nr:multi-sensor hybrid histidine kinase [Verrucomicrobiales bacterium]